MTRVATRVAVVCAGAAVSARSLGALPPEHPLVARAEELRGPYDLPPLGELDRAERLEPALHLRPANAAPLAHLLALLDLERTRQDHDVTVVLGDATGWYTALAAAGALPFDDAFRLVQEMALLAEQPLPDGGPGGQVIYPLTDAGWHRDPSLAEAVAGVLAEQNGDVHRAIELGGYLVLAATERGVGALLQKLPPRTVNGRSFPLRLARRAPYHSPLVAHVATAAQQLLGNLEWRVPSVSLVDGRGVRHAPWSADPAALERYTLLEHATQPFDFVASLRVALREYAPEALLVPGSGGGLAAICGQVVVAEGYAGIRSRPAFEAAQAGPRPLVLTIRR